MTLNRRVAILGAGPAGLSAALWLKNLGFEPTVFEMAKRAGGLQNLNFLSNDWVLGQRDLNGPALAARFVEHALNRDIAIRHGVQAERLTGTSPEFHIELNDGSSFECVALLVATGTRYRASEVLADVEGVDALDASRVAYGPYAFADLEAMAGKRILIVGGGDNAFENARLLLERYAQVQLLVRSRPRAQQTLLAAVAEAQHSGRCRILQGSRLRSIRQEGESLRVIMGGDENPLLVDRIHVLAGYEPNTAFLDSLLPPNIRAELRFDKQGYLVADSNGRCGFPGIYSAGDVCNPGFPSVVSAIAQGAAAAKTIERDTRIS